VTGVSSGFDLASSPRGDPTTSARSAKPREDRRRTWQVDIPASEAIDEPVEIRRLVDVELGCQQAGAEAGAGRPGERCGEHIRGTPGKAIEQRGRGGCYVDTVVLAVLG